MSQRGGPQEIPRPPGHRPGEPPPWSVLDPEERSLDLDSVRARLAAGPPPAPNAMPFATSRSSAVLAPLYETESGLHVVLTRRAWHLRSHTGQVAFPGGRIDDGDADLRETALREAEEEIALDPSSVEIVGELDHLATVSSDSEIVPFVGVVHDLDPTALRPEPGEVDAILHVSLDELLLPEVYREERWHWDGHERSIHFFELYGDTVWGATASMLCDFFVKALGLSR